MMCEGKREIMHLPALILVLPLSCKSDVRDEKNKMEEICLEKIVLYLQHLLFVNAECCFRRLSDRESEIEERWEGSRYLAKLGSLEKGESL